MGFKQKIEKEKGAAAVEFALCIPVLVIILTLIIDYGWYFTNELALINAVSTGARAAIKARQWKGEDPENIARQACRQALWPNPGSVSISATLVQDEASNTTKIVVSASLPYRSLTAYLPADLIPSSIAARAVMTFP